MKYKCLITDDEPLAHSVLKNYIESNSNLVLVYQCFSAEEARQYLAHNEVDILFLDIEMPEETGITFLQNLLKKPITIFTTAYLNYTLEGFELGVLDYLVKPIRNERFTVAVNRAIEFLELKSLKTDLIKESPEKNELLIKSGTKRMLIDKAAITHVQALKDYMIIFCDNKKHVVRSTMIDMESLLGTSDFIRVHKSFLVARHKIRNFSSMSIEFDQYEIPVGGKYRAEVEMFIQIAN